MRLVIVLLSTLLFNVSVNADVQVQTYAWEKILTCHNGEIVLDQGELDLQGRPTYQLVVRGSILEHLKERNAVPAHYINDKNEFILRVNTYDGEFLGFIGLQPGVQMLYWVSVTHNRLALRVDRGGRPGTGVEVSQQEFWDCYR